MSHQSTTLDRLVMLMDMDNYVLNVCIIAKVQNINVLVQYLGVNPFAHVILEKILIHSIQSNDNIISNNTTPIATIT